MAKSVKMSEDLGGEASVSDNPISSSATPGMTAETTAASMKNDIDSTPEIVKKGFRFAPPEIREMIFGYCMDEHSWTNPKLYSYLHLDKIPTIFKALEGDQKLYEEALAVYFKNTIFRISWNEYSSGKEEVLAYEPIQKLEIDIRFLRISYYEYGDPLNPSKNVQKLLSVAGDIKELTINYVLSADGFNQHLLKSVFFCLESLRKLRKFTLKVMGGDQWLKYHPVRISANKEGHNGNADGAGEVGGIDNDNKSESEPASVYQVDDATVFHDSFSAIDQGFGFHGKYDARYDSLDPLSSFSRSVWEVEVHPENGLVWDSSNVDKTIWRHNTGPRRARRTTSTRFIVLRRQ